MEKTEKWPQLYFRVALGTGYLLAVADRLGWMGPKGEHGVDWGNWSEFVSYTHVLMPFLNRQTAAVMGGLATAGELLIAIAFLIGFKLRLAALGSFLLTLAFAVSMAIFMSFKAPFNYSVFAASAGSLLLYYTRSYAYSLDSLFERR